MSELTQTRAAHAQAIATAGGLEKALASEALPRAIDTTVSEALVLGMLRQDIRVFISVLGHGSTEVGEVLRIYEEAGVLRTCGVRNEIEASHAATALRWVTGEKAAVITSIGPGALQAMAASLAPASNGLGVYYLFGDETSEDEGPNMQQVPKHEQGLFLRICALMGQAYSLHTPGALGTALKRGLATTEHPYRAGPFFLLLPMNVQPAQLAGFNLDELPVGRPPKLGAAADDGAYEEAVQAINNAKKVVIKVGGGARQAADEIGDLLELADAVAVTSPVASGVVPYGNRRNMLVGGSKGTLCGNFAMEEADLLIAVGTRFVCQSDCSRTGYRKVQKVLNINGDLPTALHYNRTTALVGDARATLCQLNRRLIQKGAKQASDWLPRCQEKRAQWEAFARERYDNPTLHDEMWGKDVLTQPAAVKTATDWARGRDAVCFFDAGDVQANGFQIVEDDRLGRTFTETGASYMGFATSAVMATALSTKPFYGLALTGDGSFTMNPQILIDGVAHGARGCILLMDNRRMAAISSLQTAQYQADYATSDNVAVDYLAWAGATKGVKALDGGTSIKSLLAALEAAHAHQGLALIHLPVYYGEHPLGGMGVYGRWNVGNWVKDTQALRHRIGL